MVATDISTPHGARGPIVAPGTELDGVRRIARLLKAGDVAALKIITEAGEPVELPPTLAHVLRLAASILSHDNAIVIETMSKEITPREAADILRLPIQQVVELIGSGELPTVIARGNRLVPLSGVLAYREVLRARRGEALTELVRLSEDSGLYDLENHPSTLKRLTELDDDEDHNGSDAS